MNDKLHSLIYPRLNFRRRFQCFLVLTAIVVIVTQSVRAASPGAIDLSYGSYGRAVIPVNGNNVFSELKAAAIQPDGKLVSVGYYGTLQQGVGQLDFMIVRQNPDGSLDSSFGANGIVFTDHANQSETAEEVVIQPDGKIIVAGGAASYGSPRVTGFKIFRYLPNGALDPNFGGGGKVYESFDDIGGDVFGMALQSDGKIVVSGNADNGTLVIARFNPDGSLDATFGSGGRFVSATPPSFYATPALQADNKIVIAMMDLDGSSTIRLVRLNSNGTLDSSFGNAGQVTRIFTHGSTTLQIKNPELAIQPDGKILVSGSFSGFNGQNQPPLLRFNPDGSLDSGFAPNNNFGLLACRGCTSMVSEIILLPDGKFYLVGKYGDFNGSFGDITVSRYLGNGAFDRSFGYLGTSVLRYSHNSGDYLRAVAGARLLSDGKIVIAASGASGANNPQVVGPFSLRINTFVTAPSARGDFDGDRKTDFAVWRPSSRYWYALNSSNNSLFAMRWGATTDVLIPDDYNYDGKTDVAVFRPSDYSWLIDSSAPFSGVYSSAFGQSGDVVARGDYDGDGYTDKAVFRPSNATWFILYSSLINTTPTNPQPPVVGAIPFGLSTDKPAPGDYDGDGRFDAAVFRPSSGIWFVLQSSDNSLQAVNWGISTDRLVPADYDGDGKTDKAVYRDGSWYVLRSSNNSMLAMNWGLATDKPVPGDYDGDGKTDIAVFRPENGYWYVVKSSDGSYIFQQWGASEDIPVPFAYLP